MDRETLAKTYLDLGMQYEELHYVECGFAVATKKRTVLYEKLKDKNAKFSKTELAELDAVFTLGKMDITQILAIR